MLSQRLKAKYGTRRGPLLQYASLLTDTAGAQREQSGGEHAGSEREHNVWTNKRQVSFIGNTSAHPNIQRKLAEDKCEICLTVSHSNVWLQTQTTWIHKKNIII